MKHLKRFNESREFKFVEVSVKHASKTLDIIQDIRDFKENIIIDSTNYYKIYNDEIAEDFINTLLDSDIEIIETNIETDF